MSNCQVWSNPHEASLCQKIELGFDGSRAAADKKLHLSSDLEMRLPLLRGTAFDISRYHVVCRQQFFALLALCRLSVCIPLPS